jgi:hypothetical protein
MVFCVSVAILEEVVFRGGIQGGLLRKEVFRSKLLGLSRANWLTSSLFAVAHIWQHPLALVPGYFAVSLVQGYFRERYNGILVPELLHAWYNLMLLLLPRLLSQGYWRCALSMRHEAHDLFVLRQSGFGERRVMREITLDAAQHGASHLLLIGIVLQPLFFGRIADEGCLHQY